MLNFKWRHFQQDIILMSVRWYVAYSLSYRDIEELMRERGITVAVDFYLSKKRDKKAAKAFFIKAIGNNGFPDKVTIDKSGANLAGLDAINLMLIVMTLSDFPFFQITIRQIKYLNNIIEQDHRGIKRITKPMMGFKAFHCAQATLAGIELYRVEKRPASASQYHEYF